MFRQAPERIEIDVTASSPVAANNDVKSGAGPNDYADLWARIRRRLKAELGEDIYASWFARIELTQIANGVAHLSVPTKFLKSWIQSHYADRILGLFAEEEPVVTRLVLDVRSAVTRPMPVACGTGNLGTPQKTGAAAPSARPFEVRTRSEATGETNGLSGNALDRRYTFASFLVGRSNALAHAAARKVAEAGGGAPVYNPLYIHAGVGLGKTHLLQAICHEIAEGGRRVIYLTADGFMYSFVSALKSQNALAFKERLRAIDLLVIDDVQFLQGKSIQQEFCHTMNALLDAGKQIVVAADRAPGDLESLDERVRSRLAGGLVVEMEGLDEDLRIRILETRIQAAKTAHPGFDVPAPVVAHVAKRIATNGRDLDGAVNRLLAHTTLSGTSLTVEMADNAIRDLVRSADPKKVKIEDIQKLVATHFNVSRADILSSRRTANVVRPRQIAMYLSKMLTLRSLPEIGRRFGGRDHTTVLHAVRKVEGLVSNDAGLRDDVELLKRMLVD